MKWTVAEVHEVANLWDNTQPNAHFHCALAHVLNQYEQPYLKDSLEECNKALDLVDSDDMRFRAFSMKADILRDMARRIDSNEDESAKEFGDSEDLKEQARQHLVKAFEHRKTAFVEPLTKFDKHELFHALFTLGTCLREVDPDRSIAAYEESATYRPTAQKLILKAITLVFQGHQRWGDIITRVEEALLDVQIDWLVYSDHNDVLQKAAFETGPRGLQMMVEAYQKMIDHWDSQNRSATFRSQLAFLQRRMLNDNVAAKKLYCEILDSPTSQSVWGNNTVSPLIGARLGLAEVL